MTDQDPGAPGAHPNDPPRRTGESDRDYAQRVLAARSTAFGAALKQRAATAPPFEGMEWGWEPVKQPERGPDGEPGAAVLRKTDLGEWLKELRAHPDGLDVAPDADQASVIEQRRMSEFHVCARCGEIADIAYIGETEKGPRWLDLCISHAMMVRELASDWHAAEEA